MMKKTLLIALGILIPGLSSAQSWDTLKPMPTTFAFPVVVAVKGYIHVMGGGGPGGATDLHIRYNPSTNKWDTMAPVPYKAQQPAGAVLGGKIHFCGGGYPNTGSRLNKHYVYDPDSNKWTALAVMPVATAIHTAVGFAGNIFVMSGQPDKQLCERYDPGNDTWTQLGQLPDQNFWYGAIASDGKNIYRFGGGGFTAAQSTSHRYDLIPDQWSTLPSLPNPLHGASACQIQDSLICIGGGYYGSDQSKVWVFNTHTKKYSSIASLPSARSYHSFVSIGDCIYSIGGNNDLDASVPTSLLRLCAQGHSLEVNKQQLVEPYILIQSTDKLAIVLPELPAVMGKVTIIDMSGKVVCETSLENTYTEFPFLGSGIFVLRIQLGESTFTEKVSR